MIKKKVIKILIVQNYNNVYLSLKFLRYNFINKLLL